jgi:cytochrome c oxidase assembly protein subunit 15
MSDSALIPELNPDGDATIVQTRLRRLVWKIAIATLLLMAVGSATRVMNAGLACPDWPLCYGQLVPSQQMNLQVFLEWFHRLDAALIGFSTLMLVGFAWWERQHLPRWLPGATLAALFLILLQGGLGALTVTELLRFDLVTAHLGTALLFFNTLLVIGTCLLPQPVSSAPIRQPILPWLAALSALAIYTQSLLGGLVGSQWALHQCFGNSELCLVMNSHIIGVIPATLSTASLIVLLWLDRSFPKHWRYLAMSIAGLLGLQILLGIATFKLHLQVEPLTVTHQAVGAALLGTVVVLATLLWRDRIAGLTSSPPRSSGD